MPTIKLILILIVAIAAAAAAASVSFAQFTPLGPGSAVPLGALYSSGGTGPTPPGSCPNGNAQLDGCSLTLALGIQ
jgi:hypothetical protein